MLFLLLGLFLLLLSLTFYLVILLLIVADALKDDIWCVNILSITDERDVDAPVAASEGIDVVFVKGDPTQAIHD